MTGLHWAYLGRKDRKTDQTMTRFWLCLFFIMSTYNILHLYIYIYIIFQLHTICCGIFSSSLFTFTFNAELLHLSECGVLFAVPDFSWIFCTAECFIPERNLVSIGVIWHLLLFFTTLHVLTKLVTLFFCPAVKRNRTSPALVWVNKHVSFTGVAEFHLCPPWDEHRKQRRKRCRS